AFIVIDIMLERLKYEKTVDIYGCVKALRKQRNFMVQTEDQYIFIHSALLEVIDAGNTEVPARNLSAHIKKLRMLDATGGSGMELEFKFILYEDTLNRLLDLAHKQPISK
ncbi:uncharacterized protein DC041_0011420, partial [Schistosoma bovis]